MDLLIQRIGRLHRHQRTRPAAHREPVLYVFGIADNLRFDDGSEAVYGGYLLTRTQYFLPDSMLLPDHISPLVEKTYGQEELMFEKELQDIYAEYDLRTCHREGICLWSTGVNRKSTYPLPSFSSRRISYQSDAA